MSVVKGANYVTNKNMDLEKDLKGRCACLELDFSAGLVRSSARGSFSNKEMIPAIEGDK